MQRGIDLTTDDCLAIVILDSLPNGFEPYYEYSGRCMYGETCFGITGNLRHIPEFFIRLTQNIIQYQEVNVPENKTKAAQVLQAFETMEMDSLGLDSIIYFKRINIKNTNEDQDED
jgi:hypothetical protein